MKTTLTNQPEYPNQNLSRQLLEDSPERTSYILKFNLRTCSLDCVLEYRKKDNLAFIHTLIPIKIPLLQREEMALFTTLFNNNLSLGCWELNMTDGSLRFRVSYLYEDKSDKFDEILHTYLKRSLNYVEICLPGIFSLAYGNTSAKEVYGQICGGIDAGLN